MLGILLFVVLMFVLYGLLEQRLIAAGDKWNKQTILLWTLIVVPSVVISILFQHTVGNEVLDWLLSFSPYYKQ